MTPSAQQHQLSFARLAGDPHSLLYFFRFLACGANGLPSNVRQHFSGLGAWQGVNGFSESLRQFTNAADDTDVLLTSRSATLMQMGSNRLADSCQRVLTVDLLWPPYRRVLTTACRRQGVSLTICPLRTAALFDEVSPDELAQRVCDAYIENCCDGLVLPLIDHRGIFLPIPQIASQLREAGHAPKQFVVDVSQAIGHIEIDFESLGCDLAIGGAHKWLGGYHPLGIGIAKNSFPKKGSQCLLSDPILRLTQEAAGHHTVRHGETAAILPLITAAGALADLWQLSIAERLSVRLANRRLLASLLVDVGWQPLRSETEQHGILVSRCPVGSHRLSGSALRESLADQGIAATCYANGLVRFSMPSTPLTETDLRYIRDVVTPIQNRAFLLSPSVSLPKRKRSSPCPMVESTTVQPAGSTRPTEIKPFNPTTTENSVV